MDQKQIEALKKKYDLKNDRDVLRLYERMQTGEFDLSTPEGRAFDDEIYDLAQKAKKRAGAVDQGQDKKKADKPGRDAKAAKADKKVLVLTKKELLIRRILTVSLFFVMIVCFAVFAVYLKDASDARKLSEQLSHKKDNTKVQQMFADKDTGAQDTADGQPGKAPQILDVYKSLYNQNKNFIGWLAIEGTGIDYPVMQTSDNTFYLDHDINQKEDKNGTLFMDCACDVLAPSTNLIIYGHNMRSGNMFGSLDKYKSESYYKKHKLINFDTIYEKGVYEVMYVFNSKVYAKDEIVFKYYQFIDAASQEEFDSNMRSMEEMSIYDTKVTAQYGDRLLTLSTCDYLENDSRFVVVAKKTE